MASGIGNAPIGQAQRGRKSRRKTLLDIESLARGRTRKMTKENGVLTAAMRPETAQRGRKSRRKTLLDIESLARGRTRKAVRTLAGIMNDETSAPLARIAAAKALLERGWGKPPELAQAVPAEQPILKVVREIVHVTKTPEQIAEEAAGEPPLIEWKDVRNPTNGTGNAH